MRKKSEIHFDINGEHKTVTYKGGMEMNNCLAVVVIFRLYFGPNYGKGRVEAENDLENTGTCKYRGVVINNMSFTQVGEISVSMDELYRIEIKWKDLRNKMMRDLSRLRKLKESKKKT